MSKEYIPISLKNIKTTSLKKRKSKVRIDELGSPFKSGEFKDFLKSLPDALAVKNLRQIVDAVIRAIDTELCKGTFGMAEETGKGLSQAINQGVKDGRGIGKAVGDYILDNDFPHKKVSILAAASRLNIPATVHVALGTDIIHMHPEAEGALIGEGSLRDFRLFASVVSELKHGVYINLGSAVIMPEVFLKALTVARNLGHDVKNFTTVNMDFIQHYRCRENVLRRPMLSGGKSYALTGHHEIMFPLLAAAIMERLKA
ncbi:MAG: hypothetical protein HZC11_03055 [Nitrospirae bacterium]|nr:hypothetical protein [Nitrospirota bacterium]